MQAGRAGTELRWNHLIARLTWKPMLQPILSIEYYMILDH